MGWELYESRVEESLGYARRDAIRAAIIACVGIVAAFLSVAIG